MIPRHMLTFAALIALTTAPAMAEEEGWHGSVGLGARSAPTYPGSDKTETKAVPFLSLSYGRLTLTGEGLAVTAYRQGRLSLAVTAGYDGGRDGSDLSFDGMPDIEDALRLGLRGSYRSGGTRITAELQRYTAATEGALLTLGADQTLPVAPRVTLNAGLEASWASADYMRGYFGISPEEALLSGQPAYGPDAGFRSVALRLGSSWQLSQNLRLIGMVSVSRYGDAAADSPVTQDRTPVTGAVFLAYHF